jgi:beta-mannanase
MPQRQFRNLRAIADGQYDFYIERWAHEAKRWGGPLMIRLGHEMNATWYPWGEKAFANTAADFVAMWRHVVTVFRRVGADNVIWVWSPARRPFEGLFPGSDYVDWTGITILNFGTVPPGWRWESFAELFAPHYEQLKAFGKPIMIAEVASAEEGGSKAEWILQAMASLRTDFPLVRAFVWFNEPQDRFWPINWSLTSSEEAARAFRRAVRDPYFIAPPR